MSFQQLKITNYLPLVILAIVVISFYPSFSSMVSVWVIWDQSMSHGIPVAALFVYLLWRSLPWQINSASVMERSALFVLLAFLSISWAIFYYIRIKVLHEICILPIFITALALTFGFKTIWQHRILLLLPIYVIPIGDFFNDHLVNLSSFVVSKMVTLARIPAFIDGNTIQIPSGRIVIAQGCSGLRYLTIALCLGHTISYLNGYKERGLLTCLLAAGILGLIANWLRIFILICIGYQTEMQSPLMADHDTFGWVLFGAICLMAIYFAPIVKPDNSGSKSNEKNSLKGTNFFIMLVALIAGPLTYFLTATEVVKQLKPVEVPGNYTSHSGAMPADLLLPKSTNRYSYLSANDIYIRLDEYVPISTHAQLVPYIPRLYNDDIWSLRKSAQIDIDGKFASWKILQDKRNEKIVGQIQWFNVGGYQVTSVNKAKLYQVPAVLSGDVYFKVITLQSVCEVDTCDDVYNNLIEESKNKYWH